MTDQADQVPLREQILKLTGMCTGPYDERHRCSALHCDHCGLCDSVDDILELIDPVVNKAEEKAYMQGRGKEQQLIAEARKGHERQPDVVGGYDERMNALTNILGKKSHKDVWSIMTDWQKVQLEHLLSITASTSAKLYTQADIDRAQTNAVAWCVGVIDDLHINTGDTLQMSVKTDELYKGVKNTIRQRFQNETGIDPAPSYPVAAKLTPPHNPTQTKTEACGVCGSTFCHTTCSGTSKNAKV